MPPHIFSCALEAPPTLAMPPLLLGAVLAALEPPEPGCCSTAVGVGNGAGSCGGGVDGVHAAISKHA